MPRRRLIARSVCFALAGVLSAPACVNAVLDDGFPGAADAVVADDANARAPLVGAASGDSADRACQVVLRDFGRVVAGDGFASVGGRLVFEGRVDVAHAAIAEGAAVRLLVGRGASWHEVAPVASTGIDDRFDRVLFHIDDNALPGVLPALSAVPGPGDPPDTDADFAVIPFLSLGTARVFDHNVIVDDAGAYVVAADAGYAVTTPPSTCAGPDGPTLTFAADWTETQSGPLVAGRAVVLDYDLARNSACRQTYNGAPTWSVVAVATFLPMNVVQQVSVVDLGGGVARPLRARLEAPVGATALELYFRNADRAGCVAFDSDHGRNYRFAVVDAPARRGPTWVGNDVATISRAASQRCEGATRFGSRLSFGSWARQRAAITDLCFEAWEPGVTDVENPELWRQLDAQVHARFDPSEPFSTTYVSLAGRSGHNARYALDLRAFDPFQWGRCAGVVPTTRVSSASGDVEQATLELYFTVNAVELRPAGGGVYRVVYEDYADAPRIHCDDR